jgi:hypothetical protein
MLFAPFVLFAVEDIYRPTRGDLHTTSLSPIFQKKEHNLTEQSYQLP